MSTSFMLDWSPSERRAWAWPDKLSPSVWMETAPVYIPANAINPEPGPYNLARTPYLREIADTLVDPSTREVWVYKPTQVGFTRLLINIACYWADQDPGALGLLMPDEDTVAEIFAEELKPTIEATPALKRRLSPRAWDSTKNEIWLDSMPIFGLYAGSVQKLARRSLKYIALDEVDKYRPFQREASPIQLLKKRTSNWLHRARLFAGSTPTTPDGNIAQGFNSCPDKRRYHLPCPKCGRLQNPLWSQVKGFKEAAGADKWERADAVRRNPGMVFYECEHCRAAWPGGANEKARIIEAGQWISDQPDMRGSPKVAFHTWAIVSPWLNLSDLAAEFIEAEADADKTRDFRNARLALPYAEVAKSIRPSVVRDKRAISPPPNIVPAWASVVVATADTQKDWFAYTIRAWGPGMKSSLVAHGEILTGSFDDLYAATLGATLPIEGGGGQAKCRVLLIDSGGDKTEKVYEFARRDIRIIPTKGMNKSGIKLFYETFPKPGVALWMVDTNSYKSILWNHLHDTDATKWMPHREVSESYCSEMASESLVRERGKFVWKENGTARNEAWDCETLQCAAADMLGVATMTIQKAAPPAPAAPTASFSPLEYRGKW